jgi:hypothetical protein
MNLLADTQLPRSIATDQVHATGSVAMKLHAGNILHADGEFIALAPCRESRP